MNNISVDTQNKFNELKNYLSTLESAAVAYSGGVDSTLLLYAASLIPGLKLMAFTVKNAMITEKEVFSAVSITDLMKINHQILHIDILSFQKVRDNTIERCYYCKTIILNKIIQASSLHGITTILEGSHSGDLLDYRPGLKAIDELGVISPLKNAGFNKESIYELSAYFNLPTSGKESYPCLATRIPYGTELTASLLNKAELAENILTTLGFKKIRARIHGDILRIEVAEEMIHDITAPEMRKNIYSSLQDAGFKYITLDLQGYRTGSMDIYLEKTL